MPEEIVTDNSSVGLLRISVFSPTIGRPAENTAVQVLETDSGRTVFEGVTDREGKISPLLLTAPPESLSLIPPAKLELLPENEEEVRAELEDEEPPEEVNEQTQLPYSEYDITAVGTNGDTIFIDGVQIYAGTTALQNITLPGQSSDIDITAPNIMGGNPDKIPEAETKPMPPPEGSVVLPRPVVPEIIVVHAGVPSDSSAPNYYVGFQDYIKNVASSEIFATWPREAIKANVIAIISFTLNRVYTEWYRGKGYDFTITNSTAYDQSFVYGRNIFTEIADVVDEVFTLYIARPELSQPLFAQYCDGIRVNRSGWLSQWGSKELADRGYSAIRILQTYYGRNIVLREAEKVEGIPLSFQGTLSQGSRGQAVRTIQNQLNAISNNFPLIPKLSADGIYGPKTAESVRTFQQIFNLPQTGITDFSTWYRISDVYVAVMKL